MTTWFTSDTHFSHKNIFFYCPERARLWATKDVSMIAQQKLPREQLREAIKDMAPSIMESVQRMNEGLIANWNSCVLPEDDVYHTGDFMMGPASEWEKILKRLNGNIYLVKGNHDYKFVKQSYVQNRVVVIKRDLLLTIKDPLALNGKSQRIVLHHFPKYVWEDGHKGVWHFHGHCHGSIDLKNRETTRIDIGVDSEIGQYYPRSYSELKKVMKNRTYKVVDGHGMSEDINE